MATKDDLITRERLEAIGFRIVNSKAHFMQRADGACIWMDDEEYSIVLMSKWIQITTMTQLKEIEDFIKRFKS